MSKLRRFMSNEEFTQFQDFLNGKDCSPELLQKEVNNSGDNILIRAYRHHDIRYFKALLESPHCTQEVLEWAVRPRYEKHTILHEALQDTFQNTEKLNLILQHRHFRKDYFLKKTFSSSTPFVTALYHNYVNAIQIISEHQYFDNDCLMVESDSTVLHYLCQAQREKQYNSKFNSQ